METRTFEPGQEVETVHGEKLTVIRVEAVILKRRGVPTGEVEMRIVAKSGGKIKQKNKETGAIEEIDSIVQFPFEKIK